MSSSHHPRSETDFNRLAEALNAMSQGSDDVTDSDDAASEHDLLNIRLDETDKGTADSEGADELPEAMEVDDDDDVVEFNDSADIDAEEAEYVEEHRDADDDIPLEQPCVIPLEQPRVAARASHPARASDPDLIRQRRNSPWRLMRSAFTFIIVFVFAAGTGTVATFVGLKHFRGQDPAAALNTVDSQNSPATKEDLVGVGTESVQPAATAAATANNATSSLIQLDQDQVASHADLAQSIGDVDKFSDYISQRIRTAPELDPSSYERVLSEELPRLKALDRWNKLVGQWSSVPMRNLDPRQAARMRDEALALLPKCEQFANGAAVRQRLPVVTAVANRVDENGASIVQALVDELSQPLTKVPFVLQTNSGARHFLLKPPQRSAAELDFERVLNSDLETVRMTVALENFDAKSSGRLSHGFIADGSLKLLAALDDSNWESTFFRIARAIYLEPHIDLDQTSDSRMDPLLKVCWLQHVMEIGCRGSQPLCAAFAEHMRILEEVKRADRADWMSPGRNDAEIMRRAQDVLRKLPSFDRAQIQVAQSLAALEQIPINPDVRWVGVLAKNQLGQWGCVLDPSLAQSPARIYGFSNVPGSECIGFRQLGVFKNTSYEFFVADEDTFFEGQPLLAFDGQP